MTKRILYIGEGVSLAHVTRPLVLAQSLRMSGYKAFFATGHAYEMFVKKSGLDCYPISTIQPEVFVKRLAGGNPLYTCRELKNYVESELSLFDQLRPDLVVGDFRLSLSVSSRLAEIPYINLTNAHWSPFSLQKFPVPEHALTKLLGPKISGTVFTMLAPAILKYHARPINTLRKRHGLPVVRSLKEAYTIGDWTLYTDLPSVAPTDSLPPTHTYIGPVIWSPNIDMPADWQDCPRDKPVIYITMGSSGDVTVLGAVIEAVKKMDVIGKVATAGRIDIARSGNIWATDYLPGREVIGESSLVICNGGSATVYQALAKGVPVVGLPTNADQFYTMGGVEKNGAGRLIRPMHATSDAIKDTLEMVMKKERYAISAKRLAQDILRYDAEKLFADFVDDLLQKGLR